MNLDLKPFFDFTKLPTKIFVVISFVSGFFIFSDEELKNLFKLNKFENYESYIGLIFLFYTALILLNFIIWLYKKISVYFLIRKIKKNLKKEIENLDYYEQSVLREFILSGKNTIDMPTDKIVQ